MARVAVFAVCAAALGASAILLAQGQLRQHGRAVVEYRAPDVVAVAAYEYSHRNHAGEWLLIEFAVQTKARTAIDRDQISLLTPDEERIPLATQEQFLADQDELRQLLQNAVVSRRPLDVYFLTRPQPTLRFFAFPGGLVHDSAISNQDEVAAGDLLFKAPDGRWEAGTYRLELAHEQANAALPIELE
jgi:hypothetical protein